nr:hypothetical protein [uncultured bacterium]
MIAERDRLNGAIAALQGTTPRRGRPAKTSSDVSEPVVAAPKPAPGRRKFTAAQKRKQAERMKAYWAAKKAQAATKTSTTSKKKAKKS